MDNISKNNSIVKIGDLIANHEKYKFFVPAYQRGYRWTTEEVRNLLDDLYEFHGTMGNDTSKMYCLQPLMVKKRDDGSYEVIDGQQRLTTVYIILKIINDARGSSMFATSNKAESFSITYETRMGSKDYLKTIKIGTELDKTNIDYYYFTNTAKTFVEWVKQDEDDDIEGRLAVLSTVLKKHTFFIWYELPADTKQSELFALFKKVNISKIQLTDGELIKALLLNKDNFKESAEKKQEEIAISWDRIEQGLREDDFWYFFNEYKEEADKDTRIDIIFELIARQINKKENYVSETEKRFSFLVISKYLEKNKQNKENIVRKIWEKVEFVYAELSYWYKKNDLYHLIGYLLIAKVKNLDIFQIWDAIADKRKTEQVKILMDSVKKSIGYNTNFQLEDFEYKTKPTKDIRNVLLLHNIATIVIKKDKEIRIPFKILKKRKWDIEHIHAINDGSAEEDNSIANLTLLDAKINREYKDKPYGEKRNVILGYDREGRFIPLCTKFVFYKLYTPEEIKKEVEYASGIWNNYDKVYYVEDMKKVIEEFFKMEWV